MKTGLAKADLPEPRQRLLELMQTINFGRIEGLPVLNGNPVLNRRPRVIREVKFGSDNGTRPERLMSDFLIKSRVVELFEQLERLGNGTIEVLEIKHGLPFRMTLAESV